MSGYWMQSFKKRLQRTMYNVLTIALQLLSHRVSKQLGMAMLKAPEVHHAPLIVGLAVSSWPAMMPKRCVHSRIVRDPE